jgi:hypothetical protein
VEGTLDEVVSAGRALPDAYLRVFVKTDGPVPGLAAQVRDELPNAVDVALRYERADVPEDARSLASLQPQDQFAAYYRREHGVEDVPEDFVRAFAEVLEDVQHDG